MIRRCQQTIARADHLVIIHPLWLGSMPALLKGFLEQVFRPDFAFGKQARPDRPGRKLLKGLERNILAFTGFRPIHRTLIGMVEARGDAGRKARLAEMRKLGRFAQ